MRKNVTERDILVTKSQLAVLHIAKSQLGLTEADYRSVLSLYGGVESAKFLTQAGFKRVVEYLERVGFKNRQTGKVCQQSKPTYYDPDGTPYPAQLSKLNGLFLALGMMEGERQQGFCRRVIKKPWPQTRTEASKVIEGLKAMLARQRNLG